LAIACQRRASDLLYHAPDAIVEAVHWLVVEVRMLN